MYSRLRKLDPPRARSLKERRRRKLDYVNTFDLRKPFDTYLRELFVNHGFINESIEKLRYITVYLTIDNIPKHYKSNGIEEIEYYRNHIESYHIKFASIVDFILILVNHACQIGLQKRKVAIARLNENDRFKELEVSKKVGAMLKAFDSLIQDRHQLIHQGKLDHDSIEEIDREINLEALFVNDAERITAFGGDKKKTIQKTVELFRSQTDALEFHYSSILVELIPVIEREIKIKELIL